MSKIFGRLALTSLLGAALLSTSCAAMQAQYNASLDNAVSLAPVDQRAYTQVAVDAFACSDNGVQCPFEWGQMASDQLAMTLSRLGYQVFDTQQFHAWLVTPPVVAVSAAPPSVGVSIGPDGVSMHATTGHEEVVVQEPGFVTYESLSVDNRNLIIQQSGINGVVTGRIMVGAPDDVTGWREVHVFIRLGDAATGALIWQGEWRENADDDESPADALNQAMQHLERALQRKAPLN